MDILFVGTSSVFPETHRDTASYVINGDILVDCGWWAPLGMRQFGADPFKIKHLLLTHCHHDHVMALPQLLFLLGHVAKERSRSLHVWGPTGEVREMLELSVAFLRANGRPELVPQLCIHEVAPGEVYSIGEVRLTSCASLHPVPGLCYRLDDSKGRSLVLSGDTAYNEQLLGLASGADMLVHEASCGVQAPTENDYGHSGGREAADLAKGARVKSLYLTHCAEVKRQEALDAARPIYPDVQFATEGLIVRW